MKIFLVIPIPQGHSNLEKKIEKIQRNWPYLLVVTNDSTCCSGRKADTGGGSRLLGVHKSNIWSLYRYFAFNIEYPKICKSFFWFSLVLYLGIIISVAYLIIM